MKNILLITPSLLVTNLVEALLPLLKNEVTFTSAHSLDDATSLSLKKMHVVLIDKRAFLPNHDFNTQKSTLMTHPKLNRSRVILFYDAEKDSSEALDSRGFADIIAKPFLADNLIRVIEKGLKG